MAAADDETRKAPRVLIIAGDDGRSLLQAAVRKLSRAGVQGAVCAPSRAEEVPLIIRDRDAAAPKERAPQPWHGQKPPRRLPRFPRG